jgi:outer membrane protein OmpA-like peptidoglycan-associated protein
MKKWSEGLLGIVSILFPVFGESAVNGKVEEATVPNVQIEYRMLERLRRGGRYYVGAGLGQSRLVPDPKSSDYKVDDDSSLSIKLMLGYEVTDHIAVEVFASPLGASSLAGGEDVDFSTYGLSGVFHIEGWQRGFSPLLKLGANNVSTDSNVQLVNEGAWGFFGGAGVEFEFNNTLALRAEYEFFSQDAQMVSLSVLKYFGGKKPESYKVSPPNVMPHSDKRLPVDLVSKKDSSSDDLALNAPDSDGDGVNDIYDACPNTPEGAKSNQLGCASFEGVMQGVKFEAGKARLTSSAREILDKVALELNRFPEVKIHIKAHTDSRGDPGFNLWLSNSRAQAVIVYLGKQGIDTSRMIPIGFGEAKPVADNATAEGRAKNRRVEFQVSKAK